MSSVKTVKMLEESLPRLVIWMLYRSQGSCMWIFITAAYLLLTLSHLTRIHTWAMCSAAYIWNSDCPGVQRPYDPLSVYDTSSTQQHLSPRATKEAILCTASA